MLAVTFSMSAISGIIRACRDERRDMVYLFDPWGGAEFINSEIETQTDKHEDPWKWYLPPVPPPVDSKSTALNGTDEIITETRSKRLDEHSYDRDLLLSYGAITNQGILTSGDSCKELEAIRS